jgi:hypothetical protein
VRRDSCQAAAAAAQGRIGHPARPGPHALTSPVPSCTRRDARLRAEHGQPPAFAGTRTPAPKPRRTHTHPDPRRPPARPPARPPQSIELGRYEMDAWYHSPYPEPYASCEHLYVCEFSLKYFRKKKTLLRHLAKLDINHPPGALRPGPGPALRHGPCPACQAVVGSAPAPPLAAGQPSLPGTSALGARSRAPPEASGWLPLPSPPHLPCAPPPPTPPTARRRRRDLPLAAAPAAQPLVRGWRSGGPRHLGVRGGRQGGQGGRQGSGRAGARAHGHAGSLLPVQARCCFIAALFLRDGGATAPLRHGQVAAAQDCRLPPAPQKTTPAPRCTARTCACCPSSSWTTRRSTTRWTPSSSTCCASATSWAATWWVCRAGRAALSWAVMRGAAPRLASAGAEAAP